MILNCGCDTTTPFTLLIWSIVYYYYVMGGLLALSSTDVSKYWYWYNRVVEPIHYKLIILLFAWKAHLRTHNCIIATYCEKENMLPPGHRLLSFSPRWPQYTANKAIKLRVSFSVCFSTKSSNNISPTFSGTGMELQCFFLHIVICISNERPKSWIDWSNCWCTKSTTVSL